MEKISYSSHESLKDKIIKFLFHDKFSMQGGFENHLSKLVDIVSDYKEEGKSLFPKFLITSDPNTIKQIPGSKLELGSCDRSESAMSQIAKIAAPLSKNGWAIYIIEEGGSYIYGLINYNVSPISISIDEQVQSINQNIDSGQHVIYLFINAPKQVEIIGKNATCHINSSLTEISIEVNAVSALANEICKKCPSSRIDVVKYFISKNLDEAIKNSHGTLVGVVTERASKTINTTLEGQFFPTPIDYVELISNFCIEGTRDDANIINSHSILLQSFFENDGIVLFTDQGKMIGYHMFIKQRNTNYNIVGGARSRAFEAMKLSNKFVYCFYRSQDGNMKTWRKK